MLPSLLSYSLFSSSDRVFLCCSLIWPSAGCLLTDPLTVRRYFSVSCACKYFLSKVLSDVHPKLRINAQTLAVMPKPLKRDFYLPVLTVRKSNSGPARHCSWRAWVTAGRWDRLSQKRVQLIVRNKWHGICGKADSSKGCWCFKAGDGPTGQVKLPGHTTSPRSKRQCSFSLLYLFFTSLLLMKESGATYLKMAILLLHSELKILSEIRSWALFSPSWWLVFVCLLLTGLSGGWFEMVSEWLSARLSHRAWLSLPKHNPWVYIGHEILIGRRLARSLCHQERGNVWQALERNLCRGGSDGSARASGGAFVWAVQGCAWPSAPEAGRPALALSCLSAGGYFIQRRPGYSSRL